MQPTASGPGRSPRADLALSRGTTMLQLMRTRLVVAALAMALVASACGGGDSASDGVASLGDDAPLSPEDTEQQLLDFAACMREQGIDLRDPVVDISGDVQLQPPPDFRPEDTGDILAAAQICEEFLEGVALGFDDIDLVAVTDTLLVFATCMRENGYDLPDPDFTLIDPGSGSVPTGGPFGDIDAGDPDFIAAFEVCDELIANLGIQGQ